jgi:threonine dehydrogenase-like Zn-dependent dehydrogenase
MRAAVLHGPGDIRLTELDNPEIQAPTDAIIRVTAACVCGSDLWPWRGIDEVSEPRRMGHEYVGVVERVGSEVHTIRVGQFVIGSFLASCGTCSMCAAGYQSACRRGELVSGAQAEHLRVPLADGTLVPTPSAPVPALIPSLLTLSDVMGTGWWAAAAARVRPGSTVAVVGDGAVGLCGIVAAKKLGAEQIIVSSWHPARQVLARRFGATDIGPERGGPGAEVVKELTGGLGADATLECVGTPEAMAQAIGSTRPGGTVGFVGVPHGTAIDARELFFTQVHLAGGPAPVRRFLPDLVKLVWDGTIDPGRVFDVTLPLAKVAAGYHAMDTREAIKVLLTP